MAFKMFSDSYTSEDVVLDWMDNSPVELNAEELSLPQFELEKTGTKPCKDMFKQVNGTSLLANLCLILTQRCKYFIADAYDETDVILT